MRIECIRENSRAGELFSSSDCENFIIFKVKRPVFPLAFCGI